MTLPVYQNTIADENGIIQPNADVYVTRESDGSGVPIYSDRDASTLISASGITQADINGFVRFYLPPNIYKIRAVSGGFERIHRYVVIPPNDVFVGESSSRTLKITDVGNTVFYSQAGDVNYTVPDFDTVPVPINGEVRIAQIGDGIITIVAGAGVSIDGSVSTVSTAGPGSSVRLVQVTKDNWIAEVRYDKDIEANLSVAGRVDVDNLRLDGNTVSTTDANGNLILSPNGSGSLQVQADTAITGGLTVSGDAVVTGDLTVNGTTTHINSTVVDIDDNIIVLNHGETGSPTQDAGIEVERGTSANVKWFWDESLDSWSGGGEDLTGIAALSTTGNITQNGSLVLDVSDLAASGGTLLETDEDATINASYTYLSNVIAEHNPANVDGYTNRFTSEPISTFTGLSGWTANTTHVLHHRITGVVGTDNLGGFVWSSFDTPLFAIDRLEGAAFGAPTGGFPGEQGYVNFEGAQINGNAVLDTTDLAANGGNVVTDDRANTFTEDQTIEKSGAAVIDLKTTSQGTGVAGSITVKGVNDSASEVEVAQTLYRFTNATAGSEEARIEWQIANTLRLSLAEGLYTPNATGGDQGPGTINAEDVLVNGVSLLTEQVTGTASRNFAESDVNNTVVSTSASDTYTIPSGLGYDGCMINFVTDGNSATIGVSGITLTCKEGGSSSTGARTIAAHSAVSLYRFSSTHWFIWGNGISSGG